MQLTHDARERAANTEHVWRRWLRHRHLCACREPERRAVLSAEHRSTIGGRQSAGRVCNVQNEVKWLIKEGTLNAWHSLTSSNGILQKSAGSFMELVLTCRFTIQVGVSSRAKQNYLLPVPDLGCSQSQILFFFVVFFKIKCMWKAQVVALDVSLL